VGQIPGLPVKFIIPNLRLTLVESVDKKANFSRHIVEKLGLTTLPCFQNALKKLHACQHTAKLTT
jgi:16S rRNA G527 N7-methylase RsmG